MPSSTTQPPLGEGEGVGVGGGEVWPGGPGVCVALGAGDGDGDALGAGDGDGRGPTEPRAGDDGDAVGRREAGAPAAGRVVRPAPWYGRDPE
jgi:hypothetical protein